MNEKERMLAGLMYDATDKELEKECFAAEELYFKFNNLPPSKNEEKLEILK